VRGAVVQVRQVPEALSRLQLARVQVPSGHLARMDAAEYSQRQDGEVEGVVAESYHGRRPQSRRGVTVRSEGQEGARVL
jgi:hypothetical protein